MNPSNKNNVWCWRWHLRAVHPRYRASGACSGCQKARWAGLPKKETNPILALWDDDGAEYWWLRDMGYTPQQIGEKHNVKWESFQRTLYRRIGGKQEW